MSVDDVVTALRSGEIAAFATETLWSLSCNAFDPEAVQKVFLAKRRPEGVPLAVGFPSWGMARQYVETTPLADALAQKHLPGPLSIVVRRSDERLAHVAPGYDTLSIRVPDHPVALEILERVGPCVMTSANLHRGQDPMTGPEVASLFPDIPVAGDKVPGTGTTIIDATGPAPKLLRPGVIDFASVASEPADA